MINKIFQPKSDRNVATLFYTPTNLLGAAELLRESG
jgi:hypothetical protein